MKIENIVIIQVDDIIIICNINLSKTLLFESIKNMLPRRNVKNIFTKKNNSSKSLDHGSRFFDPRNDVTSKKVFVEHEDLPRSFLDSILKL
jgi:hypothetical protein